MKNILHHWGIKMLALMLAICLAVSSIIGLICIFIGIENNFYEGRARTFFETDYSYMLAYSHADNVVHQYKENPDSDIVQEYLRDTFSAGSSSFSFQLHNTQGVLLLESANLPATIGYRTEFTFYSDSLYLYMDDFGMEDDPKNNLSVTIHAPQTDEVYYVTAYISDPLHKGDDFYLLSNLYNALYAGRYKTLAITGGSILLFVMALIYLLCVSGKRESNGAIVPNFQDKIPLDLYFLLITMMLVPGLMVAANFVNLTRLDYLFFILAALCYLVSLGIATLLTLATRLKMGKWWKNTIAFSIIIFFWRLFTNALTRIKRTIRNISVTWQIVFVWGIITLFYLSASHNVGRTMFLSIILLLVVSALITQMRKLRKAGEQIANGNLEYRVDTAGMFSPFKEHGQHLNRVSEGTAIAIDERMKSEHLKTELITNVSHDIKTPLTSIINYVDLLKKQTLPEEALAYLDVLDRQSRRLKKLTEDLVEASKASTGNITVHLVSTNLDELITQAITEYSEQMDKTQLEIISTTENTNLTVLVDGTLMWRVLSNLLSNVCNYSQEGTRVYLDVKKEDNEAVILIKNVSKTQLNIPADELMERFVRGDSSRSTNGSGLGLNIARSLVELQNGRFGVEIDGDLFKAYVRCPLSNMPIESICEEKSSNR